MNGRRSRSPPSRRPGGGQRITRSRDGGGDRGEGNCTTSGSGRARHVRAPFRVRRARRGDLPGVQRCLRAAFERYRAEYTVPAFRDTVLTRSTARRRFESMPIWVATDARGRVVGTVAAEFQSLATGHLRGMAVRPRWHGTGVGQALLNRALAALAARGCRRVTLDTTRPLARAVAFYRRNGFRRTGRVSDFFGMSLFEYGRRLASTTARSGRAADPTPSVQRRPRTVREAPSR